MKFMKKLLSCVTSAEYAVMVAAFVAMVASYFISVLNRNFIQASMPWTEEIAIYSMTYMALLGTEVGLRDGTQVAVTAVVDKLHGVAPVSYTHLDVYKRQDCSQGNPSVLQGHK